MLKKFWRAKEKNEKWKKIWWEEMKSKKKEKNKKREREKNEKEIK
jgi:hypothetical protein